MIHMQRAKSEESRKNTNEIKVKDYNNFQYQEPYHFLRRLFYMIDA